MLRRSPSSMPAGLRFAGSSEVVGAKLKEVAGRETPGAPWTSEPLKRSKPKRAFGRVAV